MSANEILQQRDDKNVVWGGGESCGTWSHASRLWVVFGNCDGADEVYRCVAANNHENTRTGGLLLHERP